MCLSACSGHGWAGGIKHYLYPPDVSPARGYNPFLPTLEWVRRNYNAKGRWKPSGKHKQKGLAVARPVECLQMPGEVLYVPGGWYHSWTSCGETVSVFGHGFVDREAKDGPTQLGHLFVEGMKMVQDGAYETAAKLLRKADQLSNNR